MLINYQDQELKIQNIKQRIITSFRGKTPTGILTIIDQGVFSLTSFLTSIIVGRSTTKEEFGLFLLGYTIIYLGLEVQGACIITPYTIYSPQYNLRKSLTYTGSTLIHQILLSIVIIMFFLLVIFIIPQNFLPASLGPVLPSLAVVFGFFLLRDYVRRTSFAALQMKTALVLDIVVSALQLSGLISLMYFKSLTIPHAFLVIGFSCCTASIVWMIK